jgi:hypothetical protein
MFEPATFEDGGRSVEAGIAEMHDRMRGGRFKIFRHKNDDFIEEMALYHRLYHRKDGLLVKESDDAISAVRYALMMKRNGQTERGKASCLSQDGCRMTDPKYIFTEIRRPSRDGSDPGLIEDAHYIVTDGMVQLCTRTAFRFPVNAIERNLARGRPTENALMKC